MLDKSIPFYNVIMRCDGTEVPGNPCLPAGYEFCTFQSGDEIRWAQMEVDNNDFDSVEEAVQYFQEKYLEYPEKLKESFIGVRDRNSVLCGAVIGWEDYRNGEKVASVHWLITDPKVQNRGIGTALVQSLILHFRRRGLLPIYLHTQPWSYTAIGIYSRFGFRMLKTDSFSEYENQSDKAMAVLESLLSRDKMKKLRSEML